MLPTGVLINAVSVFLGGIVGAAVGGRLSDHFKTNLSSLFGVCAMAMGINALGNVRNMPAVIFAVIVGTAIGLAIHLGSAIHRGAVQMQKVMTRILRTDGNMNADDLSLFVTIIVLFCASGTGIYGSLDAGMTGNHSILISKSILDFFTAMIFACQLGYVLSAVCVPQLVFFLLLFYGAGFLVPLTTPNMIGDFKACGGVLLLATGFRMMKVKDFSVADMIPAMVLVMPCSWLWENVIIRFL